MPKTAKEICLMPECKSPQKYRGLCESCYQSASRLIRLGRTTWETLEEKGWAYPANSGAPLSNPASKAILGSSDS